MALIRFDRLESPQDASHNVVALHARPPERLVGVGFRCSLTCFTTGDSGCWQQARTTFSSTVGQDRAKALMMDLMQFVRAVSATSVRDIGVQPADWAGFCRDECLAISIIAACQHEAMDALRSSASALIGCDDIGDTLNGAQSFARGLKSAQQLLAADSICPATCELRIGCGRPILQGGPQ
jgi:hypothetical protein